MQSKAATVEEYLDELPSDRRAALEAVRAVLLANLDADYEEGMQYGMIGYYVPHRVYSAGYHCDPSQPLPFAGLASQKNHMALYLMSVYDAGENAGWFREAWAGTGKKLDMGKCCVRFRKLDDLALDLIGETIRRTPAAAFIRHYEAATQRRKGPAKAARKGARGKRAARGRAAASSKKAASARAAR
jgi:hypothetical protein